MAGNHHEDARAQHVIEVVANELRNQFVLLFSNLISLCTELAINLLFIDTFEQHLTLTVRELSQTIRQLVVLINKHIQAVVQRSTSNALHSILNADHDIALFQYDRHDALVIHEETDHTDGIQQTRKMEFAMNHLAGVDILKIVVLHSLQIELAAIQCRDGRRSTHTVRAGARG